MRELKFRAWQKHHKEMFEVAAISFVSAVSTGFVVKKASSGLNVETWALDEVELMQFTGIKDKAGKAVYEGDIVQCDAIGIQGFVTWVETGPGFYILNVEKTAAYVLHDDWEVVGNVWENSELVRLVG